MAETETKKSRYFRLFITPAAIIVCVFLAYCISRDAEISFSKDKWLVISPKGNHRIKELEKEIEDFEERYARIEDQYHSITAKYTKILKIVGADIKGSDDAALDMITLMAVRSRELDSDVNISLSVIRTRVFRNKSINVNSLVDNNSREDLYKHIQKFLRCLGIYNGSIDGDQAATCLAVTKFQTQCGVKVDGKIGKDTLFAMEKMFQGE